MNIRIFIASLMLMFMVGCAMPTTTVKTVDTRPSISITGAPQGSVLFVDGLKMGNAELYDGYPNILIIEPGTHRIEVKNKDTLIFKQLIFVESELKNIIIK